MKTSDITDARIYELVRAGGECGQQLARIEEALREFPSKVVRAKLGRMIEKGRLQGCACGCRGDFKVVTE
jgi:hypothetical protein